MDNTPYASVFERLVARIIDKIIVTVPLYFILTEPMRQLTRDVIMGCALMVYVIALTYFLHGQTIGKKMMGIKITATGKKRLTIVNYTLRELTFNLFPLFLIPNKIIQTIWGIWILVSVGLIIKGDRGIHDYAAKTIVVSTKEMPISSFSDNPSD